GGGGAGRIGALKKQSGDVEAKLAAFEPVAKPGRTFVLVDEPQVTQVIPAIGRELYNDGAGPGERYDPGDATRLPNVGRGYFYWNNVAGRDVFTWNPQKSGRYRLWLSWGCGH